MTKRASQADWDGQTRRWHDRHWFHEDADGNAVREYNTLTEKMPAWAIVAVLVVACTFGFGLYMWTQMGVR